MQRFFRHKLRWLACCEACPSRSRAGAIYARGAPSRPRAPNTRIRQKSSAIIAALGAICGLVLASCQSASSPSAAPGALPITDGPPEYIPHDLSQLPDPVPVNEPKSATGNPPSYSVFGKTYYTLDSAAGYEATGSASWYGRKFQGRRTSSGETFDTLKLTAAHPTLPIPSYVAVTNLENGRRVVVRVNDRGPFHDGRIIDVSYAAAVKLGFADAGTARVRVAALVDVPVLYLQAGAFQRVRNANRLRGALERLTGKAARVVRTDDDDLYRVRLGPLDGEREAERLQALIVMADYGVPEIHYGEAGQKTR